MGRHLNGKQLVRVAVQRILDLLIAAVLVKIFIDLSGKLAEVQLVDLILQQTCRLKYSELLRLFLVNQANTLEAVVAFLGSFKDTGP